jgi:hypothetical protein
MTLQGSKRKVTYVASYEAIAFLFGTLGFLSFTDSSPRACRCFSSFRIHLRGQLEICLQRHV